MTTYVYACEVYTTKDSLHEAICDAIDMESTEDAPTFHQWLNKYYSASDILARINESELLETLYEEYWEDAYDIEMNTVAVVETEIEPY